MSETDHTEIINEDTKLETVGANSSIIKDISDFPKEFTIPITKIINARIESVFKKYNINISDDENKIIEETEDNNDKLTASEFLRTINKDWKSFTGDMIEESIWMVNHLDNHTRKVRWAIRTLDLVSAGANIPQKVYEIAVEILREEKTDYKAPDLGKIASEKRNRFTKIAIVGMFTLIIIVIVITQGVSAASEFIRTSTAFG